MHRSTTRWWKRVPCLTRSLTKKPPAMATEAAKATALLRKKNDPKATNWAYGQESHASQMHSVRPGRGRAR